MREVYRMRKRLDLADRAANRRVAALKGVRIARKHRPYAMTCDLSKISIVDSSDTKMGDVAVAALMGTDV